MKRLIGVAALSFAVACEAPTGGDPPEASLDTQLRQLLQGWGALPIRPVPPQPAALVELGRDLFFDRILSGNRDVSCGTCHDPLANLADGLSLSVGTGGTGGGTGSARTLGPGRSFVPRNAPSLLNEGLGFFSVLWDGRVNEEFGPGTFKGPAGVVFPPGLTNLVAAQAMLPVLNRTEMRGESGDVDVFGNPNELATISDSDVAAIWKAAMSRVLAVQEYAAKFSAAYPTTPASSLGFQHVANAIAAFQLSAFTKTNSPFDRYLARDDGALSEDAKRGALLFFGEARCASCHSGALLGGMQFANVAAPQIGPGVGSAAPLDIGRAEHLPPEQRQFYRFSFRVPALRNVELTAPYMHSGAYPTLEAVVRHYTNADSAQRSYDVNQVAPPLRGMHRGDAATVDAVLATLDGRLRFRIPLTSAQQAQMVAFLKSLTDPAARDLSGIAPTSVPSGLPIRD